MSSRIVFSSAAVIAAAAIGLVAARQPTPSQPVLGTRTVKVLEVDGLKFKDLNKNGKLDAYEDWRKPVDARVDDLVSQMTLEEKAGLMVSPTLTDGAGRRRQRGVAADAQSVRRARRGRCRGRRRRC